MKRAGKLIALVLVIAIMAGGYAVINNRTKVSNITEEEGEFSLFEKAYEDITALKWDYEGTEFSFAKQDDNWVNELDPNFPTDNSAVDKLAQKIAGLTASRKLESIEAIEDYGLKEPEFSVSVTLSDGTETAYKMGEATPFGDGYYTMLSGDDNVYTCEDSIKVMFNTTYLKLALKEELPEINTENITRVVVSDIFDVYYSEDSKTINPDRHWYSTSTNLAIDDSKVQSVIDGIAALDWSTLYNAQATEEDLNSIALTDDQGIKIAVYEGKTPVLDMFVGNNDESGDMYARLNGSNMVYTVSSDLTAPVLVASEDSMQVKEILPISAESLKTAVFTLNGSDYTFDVDMVTIEVAYDQDNSPDATPEPENNQTELVATLNGTDTDAEAFKTLWSLVEKLSIKANSEEAASEDKLILTVTATNTIDISETLKVYELDADNYLGTLSNGQAFTVSADSVDKIIRNLKQFN